MNTTTSTTPALSVAGLAVPLVEQPQYRHVGGGTFKPANRAAWREVDAYNAWVDEVHARTTRGMDQ